MKKETLKWIMQIIAAIICIMDKLIKGEKLSVDDETLKEITKLNQRIETLYKLYETNYTDAKSN